MHWLPFVLLSVAAAAPVLGELRSDIEFASRGGVSLTLDAWVPEGKGPFPAVIIVHGGGFIAGDKQTYVKPLFPILTEAGFVWFTINYRLAPSVHFPEPVRDVEDAVRWVMKNAARYKVDPKRVALTGESAGGHLVSYVAATTGRDLGLRAIVPIYAPHDLLSRADKAGALSENVQKFLGIGPELTPDNRERLRLASPITHANKNMPRILLIHGTADAQVLYEQSVSMQKRLEALGVPSELVTVHGGAHGMGSWEKLPSQEWKVYLRDWLVKVLR